MLPYTVGLSPEKKHVNGKTLPSVSWYAPSTVCVMLDIFKTFCLFIYFTFMSQYNNIIV